MAAQAQDLDRAGRLRFLQIDEDDRDHLRDFREVLAPVIDGLLDQFYGHITRYPATASKFGGPDRIIHARRMQKEHWLEKVFAGNFDDAYFAQVTQIGKVHQKIGLEPRWYTAGYCFILNLVFALAVEHYAKDPAKAGKVISAINKAAFLDMDLATSVYIETNTAAIIARELGVKADLFEREVKSVVGNVASAASQMESASKTLFRTAEEASQQSSTVTAAAQAATSNIQSVAAAAEELSFSINEITRQVGDSARITGRARDEADRTNTIVHSLAEAAGKIDQVVRLITDIASQTNLLALNATIEAARAGEAGRGFAVVAKEVKNLATQTSKATDEVTGQIAAVQEATHLAVDAIGGIASTIGQISDISRSIAAAVKEQGIATQEIAQNVQRAAMGTTEVTQTITRVSVAAKSTGQQAQDVLKASTNLSRDSASLSAEVEKFVKEIRSA
jgi:methyl-accepting chemotaxis protein